MLYYVNKATGKTRKILEREKKMNKHCRYSIYQSIFIIIIICFLFAATIFTLFTNLIQNGCLMIHWMHQQKKLGLVFVVLFDDDVYSSTDWCILFCQFGCHRHHDFELMQKHGKVFIRNFCICPDMFIFCCHHCTLVRLFVCLLWKIQVYSPYKNRWSLA